MTKALFLGAVTAAVLMAGAASAATIVPLAPFKSFGLSGGGEVVLKHGNTQSVTLIAGSTEFTNFRVRGDSLEIEACNRHCPNHYDLKIEIVMPVVDGVAIQGGGSITAEGSFPAASRLDAAVSGGGDINVRAIPVTSVNAAVQGGGDIATLATRDLNAAVSGGGQITYWGNPEVSQAVNGGGSIDHAAP